AQLEERNRNLAQEVSRRTQAEALMRQSTEHMGRLAAIIESSKDAIVGTAADGVITSWNPAATTLFGYKSAEAIGHPIGFLNPPDRLQEEVNVWARIREGEPVDHFDTVRRRK